MKAPGGFSHQNLRFDNQVKGRAVLVESDPTHPALFQAVVGPGAVSQPVLVYTAVLMQCWGGRGTQAATTLLLCQGLPSQTLLFAVSFLQGCQISQQPKSTTESPTDWFLDSVFQGVVILSDACPSEDTGTR